MHVLGLHHDFVTLSAALKVSMMAGNASLAAIVARIEERLEALKISATQASLKAGLGKDGVRNLQRAIRSGKSQGGANLKTIQGLAPVLNTSVAWLLEGHAGEQSEGIMPRDVPVIGVVGAGSLVYAFEDSPGEVDRVLAPATATPDTVAVRIEGDSLGSFYNGWYAFYDEVRDPPTADLVGKLCVLWLDDGRVLIKRLQRGSVPARWTLESLFDPPIYDVQIVAAAPVIDMGPRVPH